MNGEQIRADPDKLDSAKKEFEKAAQQWSQALDRFAAGISPLTRDALGALAPMDEIWSLVAKFRSQAIDTVGLAAWQLEIASANLGTCAANYRACGSDIHVNRG